MTGWWCCDNIIRLLHLGVRRNRALRHFAINMSTLRMGCEQER